MLRVSLVVLEMLAQPELLGHRTMSRNLKPRFAGKPGFIQNFRNGAKSVSECFLLPPDS